MIASFLPFLNLNVTKPKPRREAWPGQCTPHTTQRMVVCLQTLPLFSSSSFPVVAFFCSFCAVDGHFTMADSTVPIFSKCCCDCVYARQLREPATASTQQSTAPSSGQRLPTSVGVVSRKFFCRHLGCQQRPSPLVSTQEPTFWPFGGFKKEKRVPNCTVVLPARGRGTLQL